MTRDGIRRAGSRVEPEVGAGSAMRGVMDWDRRGRRRRG